MHYFSLHSLHGVGLLVTRHFFFFKFRIIICPMHLNRGFKEIQMALLTGDI
jgi:hypothetical protein